MAIILPRRFTSQPQYGALLDKNHPLAKDVTLALNCYNPYINAVDGSATSLTPGGSGFSFRDTEQGLSLLTPDGGWADFAISEDWVGPNTVIALCRVNSADSNFGGILSKNSSGTSTQFAVGRFSTEDALYIGVDDSTALKVVSSTVSGLAGFNVLSFSHSGAASSAASYSVNGVLTGVTSNLGTQPSGSGLLRLGGERAGNASFDSDVDWVAFVRFSRVLTDAEVAEVSGNIWALWESPGIRYVDPPAGSANGVGSSAGSATVSGIGASDNAQPGSSAGTSTVSGIGSSDTNSIAASSGTSAVSGIGAADFNAVGAASGSATVDGAGTSSTGSSGSASGTCSVSGAGSSAAASDGVASGVASVSAIGASEALSTGTASGTSTVSGVGDSVQAGSAVGSASGVATVSGVGASVVAAIGNASGDCNVSGAGAKTGGEVESFSGGYLYDDTRESHAERKRKKRIELGIEEEKPVLPTGLDRFEISNLAEERPVAPTTKKQLIPARQQKKLAAQEAENAELKMLLQLEIEREEEAILRFLMEL